MHQIVISRRLAGEATAKEFRRAELVAQDGYQVTLNVSEWVPLHPPDAVYFLDAGAAGDPDDSVTCVDFSNESNSGPPFRLTGHLFPELTCRKS